MAAPRDRSRSATPIMKHTTEEAVRFSVVYNATWNVNRSVWIEPVNLEAFQVFYAWQDAVTQFSLRTTPVITHRDTFSVGGYCKPQPHPHLKHETEFWQPMVVDKCTKQNCHRCESKLGGYTFPWSGPWLCSRIKYASPDMMLKPLNFREIIDNCRLEENGRLKCAVCYRNDVANFSRKRGGATMQPPLPPLVLPLFQANIPFTETVAGKYGRDHPGRLPPIQI
jgi:hypothetical protein